MISLFSSPWIILGLYMKIFCVPLCCHSSQLSLLLFQQLSQCTIDLSEYLLLRTTSVHLQVKIIQKRMKADCPLRSEDYNSCLHLLIEELQFVSIKYGKEEWEEGLFTDLLLPFAQSLFKFVWYKLREISFVL